MNFILTPTDLSVFLDKPYQINSSHPSWSKAVEAVKEGRFEDIPELVSIPKAIARFTEGRLDVSDLANGVVKYNGEALRNYAVDRLFAMLHDGFNVEPLVKFLENLVQNPSHRAVNELYGFLEHGKMPLTPDGCFLAYKRVRSDYKSVHDGKTDNSIGARVEMPRNHVDDNSDRTCSRGLHFCSHAYLSSFSGDRVVVLKVNPRDVVSIPKDYNDTKGRACGYDVIGELSPEEVQKALSGSMFEGGGVVDFDDRDIDMDQDFNDYQDGYDDGRRDAENNDSQEYVVTNGTTYQNGYIDGYASVVGLENMVRTVVDKLARVPGTNDPSGIMDDDEMFLGVDAIDPDHVRGYTAGYSDGRAKINTNWPQTQDVYASGYAEGHKDGRGHQPRQFVNR